MVSVKVRISENNLSVGSKLKLTTSIIKEKNILAFYENGTENKGIWTISWRVLIMPHSRLREVPRIEEAITFPDNRTVRVITVA